MESIVSKLKEKAASAAEKAASAAETAIESTTAASGETPQNNCCVPICGNTSGTGTGTGTSSASANKIQDKKKDESVCSETTKNTRLSETKKKARPVVNEVSFKETLKNYAHANIQNNIRNIKEDATYTTKPFFGFICDIISQYKGEIKNIKTFLSTIQFFKKIKKITNEFIKSQRQNQNSYIIYTIDNRKNNNVSLAVSFLDYIVFNNSSYIETGTKIGGNDKKINLLIKQSNDKLFQDIKKNNSLKYALNNNVSNSLKTTNTIVNDIALQSAKPYMNIKKQNNSQIINNTLINTNPFLELLFNLLFDREDCLEIFDTNPKSNDLMRLNKNGDKFNIFLLLQLLFSLEENSKKEIFKGGNRFPKMPAGMPAGMPTGMPQIPGMPAFPGMLGTTPIIGFNELLMQKLKPSETDYLEYITGVICSEILEINFLKEKNPKQTDFDKKELDEIKKRIKELIIDDLQKNVPYLLEKFFEIIEIDLYDYLEKILTNRLFIELSLIDRVGLNQIFNNDKNYINKSKLNEQILLCLLNLNSDVDEFMKNTTKSSISIDDLIVFFEKKVKSFTNGDKKTHSDVFLQQFLSSREIKPFTKVYEYNQREIPIPDSSIETDVTIGTAFDSNEYKKRVDRIIKKRMENIFDPILKEEIQDIVKCYFTNFFNIFIERYFEKNNLYEFIKNKFTLFVLRELDRLYTSGFIMKSNEKKNFSKRLKEFKLKSFLYEYYGDTDTPATTDTRPSSPLQPNTKENNNSNKKSFINRSIESLSERLNNFIPKRNGKKDIFNEIIPTGIGGKRRSKKRKNKSKRKTRKYR